MLNTQHYRQYATEVALSNKEAAQAINDLCDRIDELELTVADITTEQFILEQQAYDAGMLDSQKV